MSNREKSAWVELIALTAIWGFYCVSLFGAIGSGAIDQDGFARAMGLRFALCAVLSIIVGAAAGVLLEIGSRQSNAPARDEREAWAGLRATRIAHGTLIVLLLGLTVAALLFGGFAGQALAARTTSWLDGLMGNGLILFAHGALACLVLAELIHYGALIAFLRRG